MHKGDAGNGLFIQITADHEKDAPIPDKAGQEISSMSFGVLALAQALGDRQALLDARRKVIRFHLSKNIIAGIKALTEAIKWASNTGSYFQLHLFFDLLKVAEQRIEEMVHL